MNRIQSMGGRKYTLSILTLLMTTILTAFKIVDGGVFTTVILGTVGAFIVGNVGQDIGLAKFGKSTNEAE